MKFLMFLCVLLPTLSWGGFYDLKEMSIEGKEYDFKALKGKVVLVANIASQCGYTSQLEDLEALWKKYKGRGLVVLGVPTNDFGGQTPEDDKGMKEFCQKNYSVSFPLLNKRTVKGAEMRPLFKYLTKESKKELQGDVSWNFEKFLLDKNGTLVARFGSSTKPMDSEITKKIEELAK